MRTETDLDYLKAEQDRAFRHKQDAWQAQDHTWHNRRVARDSMDRAHHAKQDAYQDQQQAWEELQRLRERNGSRINHLNGQQETTYQNMKDAFERASAAYEARDGVSARTYADEGHRYKAETQEVVSERRMLIQEIRDTRANHEAIRPTLQRAKVEFECARDEHSRTRSEHDRARAEFERAKSDFDEATSALHAHQAAVRAQRKDDKRSLAQRAGIPFQYLDDVYVSIDTEGNVNIYFGGLGSPEGPGHGHYVMDRDGNLVYARDPLSDHGSHNFTDYEERQHQRHSSWEPRGSQPPDVGVISGTELVVSFKTGGATGDQTLIADGDYSDDREGFDERHNHYGSAREGGWIDQDRGYYTGPEH